MGKTSTEFQLEDLRIKREDNYWKNHLGEWNVKGRTIAQTF